MGKVVLRTYLGGSASSPSMQSNPSHPSTSDQPPLCVDLDGTFIHSDLLLEGILRILRDRPLIAPKLVIWALAGRPSLKLRVADESPNPVSAPAINSEVEAFLQDEKKRGRAVVLVTATHSAALDSVRGLFPFDEVCATVDGVNLKGKTKANYLVQRYGKGGFDYIGDSRSDRWVWAHARKAMAVARSPQAAKRIAGGVRIERVFSEGFADWPDWVHSLRLHHWAKNLLILVPALAGHHIHGAPDFLTLAAGFVMMGIVASGTYLWNDLLDLDLDRGHSHKKRRLAASGRTPLRDIGIVSMLLVGGGLAGAFLVDPYFCLLLFGYAAATLSYSLHFKKVAIADIFILTFLYLSRVVAGIIISDATVSFWLFAFTFLLFLSLAAAKRHVELKRAAEGGHDSIKGRGYLIEDLSAVSALGIASGVTSCVVLGFYSNSPQVTALYEHPEWIWGICVVALYWITRIWLLTHRGSMHDDPLVFALTDRITWMLGFVGLICVLLAQPQSAT
jgi:4-hydroxybenzoate polyprenyltransferase